MTKTFVVSYFNHFEGELVVRKVEATNDVSAASIVLKRDLSNCKTLEDVYDMLSDEEQINVLDILAT